VGLVLLKWHQPGRRTSITRQNDFLLLTGLNSVDEPRQI